MQQSKLLQLLRSLTPKEFKGFSRLLCSPLFNTNPIQVRFYELLKKEYPDFNSGKLTKEKVYKKLYSGRVYHYHHMANLMSEMSRLVEEYLVQLELEQEAFQKQKILVKALGRRNRYELFVKETKDLVKELDRLPFRDAGFYRDQLALRSDLFFHPLNNKYRSGTDHTEAMMNSLDRYYALLKLQWSAVMKTRERLLSVDYPVWMLEAVMEQSQNTFSKDNPLFAIYANIFLLQKEPVAATVFTDTRDLFIAQLPVLRKKEQRDILWFLINYAIGRINRGFFEFNREALDLYKTGLQNDLVLEKGRMSEATFNNIVSTAGILEEFDWAFSFIENYAGQLEEEILESAKALAIGELKFRQRHFDAVIDLLGDKHFPKILHQLKARNLLLKSWFEQFLLDEAYYDLVMAQIESFEKFVKRNKDLSATKAKAYVNFLGLLRSIVVHKSQLKFNDNAKIKLLEKIDTHKTMTNKFWLKSRIELL